LFLQKVFRVLKSDEPIKRIILFFNKTDYLRSIFKWVQIALHFPLYLKRRKVAQMDLDSAKQKVRDDLHRQGYSSVTHFFSQKDLDDLKRYGEDRLGQQDQISVDTQKFKKKIWLRLSDLDENMSTSHPLMNVSLNQSILEILATYFNSAPFLDYTLLTLSTNESGLDTLEHSQQWHFDRDDYPVVKLFFYLSDVDSVANGPFTFFDKQTSKKFNYRLVNSYWSDETVLSQLPREKMRQMMAPKLSAFLVCTDKCLHMGSRVAKGQHRLMTTSTYFSQPSAHPWAGARQYRINSELSPLQRFAVEKS
jgi:hypothetical protein